MSRSGTPVRLMALLLLGSVPACAQSRPVAPGLPPLSADSVRALATAPLPPAATQADLALLAEAYRTLHPGLTRYQGKAEFEARVDSLRRWFAEPRSRGDTYLALAHLSATLRCSHTYLNFWNQPGPTKRWLLEGRDKLPFTFHLTPDDRWVVDRAVPSAPGDSAAVLLPGDTVLAVNDVPTAELVARLLAHARGDGFADGKRRALLEFRQGKKYETTDALLPLLLPPEAGRYRLTVRRGGAALAPVVGTVAARERDAGALPAVAARPPWSFEVREGVGLLVVDGFGGDEDEWAAFVRQAFRRLSRDSIRALVVDLRQNEGGSDAAAALLLSHLSPEPVALPPVRRYTVYQTVPAALRPHLQTWDDGFYDRRGDTRARGDGTFDLTDRSDWPAQIRPARDAFRGRVFLVTSLVNSSASHTLVRLLARRPGVTLVGEPTGGSLRASTGGNLFFLQLPATGFEADIPLVAYDFGAAEPATGVPPDFATPVREALTVALAQANSPGAEVRHSP